MAEKIKVGHKKLGPLYLSQSKHYTKEKWYVVITEYDYRIFSYIIYMKDYFHENPSSNYGLMSQPAQRY